MLYGDYDLVNNGKIQEIRLLKHHSGRLRDNQIMAKLFLFTKAALEAVGGLISYCNTITYMIFV